MFLNKGIILMLALTLATSCFPFSYGVKETSRTLTCQIIKDHGNQVQIWHYVVSKVICESEGKISRNDFSTTCGYAFFNKDSFASEIVTEKPKDHQDHCEVESSLGRMIFTREVGQKGFLSINNEAPITMECTFVKDEEESPSRGCELFALKSISDLQIDLASYLLNGTKNTHSEKCVTDSNAEFDCIKYHNFTPEQLATEKSDCEEKGWTWTSSPYCQEQRDDCVSLNGDTHAITGYTNNWDCKGLLSTRIFKEQTN